MKIKLSHMNDYWKKISLGDKVYLSFALLFFGALLSEFFQFLIRFYSFQRISIFFMLLSVIYIGYRFHSLQEKRSFVPKRDLSKKVGKIFETLFFSTTVIYASLVVSSFFVPISYYAINIALLVVIAVYGFWKQTGGSFQISFPLYNLSETNFLKILSITLAFTYILLSTLTQKYTILGQEKLIFMLTFLGIALLAITLLFSRVFQKISHFFVSGELITFLKKNIQITLSLFLFFVSSLFILFKFGAFDFLFVKKIEHIAEFVPQSQNIVIEQEEKIGEKKLVSEVYTLSSPLSLGQSGESVRLLQEVLQKLGTYTQEISSVFDEYTRETLRTTLIEKCDWPQSAQGIFGPQAKACLDSLEIEVTETTPE